MALKSFNLIFLFFSIGLISQELPPIVTFPPEEYQADNQNWMVSQDYKRHVYFANNAGLLEFDGAKWKLYGSPNGSIVRSVKVIDERVYTGCFMEFGYWERDGFGNLNYESLVPKLQDPLVDDEQFWNILEIGDWVLFQSLDRIYIYNTRDESFKIIGSKAKRARIFKVGAGVFFQKSNEGIYKIENGESVLVSKDPIFMEHILVGAFQVDTNTLFLSENGGFYQLNGVGLRKWNIAADKELSGLNIYSSILLRDGSFMLGTISDGIYHIGPEGQLLNKVNKEKGLYNNTVLSMFQDMDENLWLGLDNGISVINLNSPFTEFKDLKGKVGNVYAAQIFNENLYIGTNQGLFYKAYKSSDAFRLVDQTQGQVWCLKVLDNTLFCGHNQGTYVVDKEKAIPISDYSGTWNIKRIRNHENLLLQGNYEGLSVLEKINGQWRFRNRLEGFDFSSRFFEFIDDDQLMLNNEYKGMFRINVDSNFTRVLKKENEQAKGFGSSLVRYMDNLIYTSNSDRQVFKFNKENQKFVYDSLLTPLYYNANEDILGILISDHETNKLWGFSDKNIIGVTPSKFNNKPESIKISVPSTFRRGLGISGFENLTHLEDNRYLIGAADGYIVLNVDKIKSKDYWVEINSVEKENLGARKVNVPLGQKSVFPSNENNLLFSFSVPEFDKYLDVSYQYLMEGLDDQWSDWFKDPNISIRNLRFGEYTFKVRARIGSELSKNIDSYSFKIKRPWYYSNWAILGYILGISIVTFIVHRLYKSYFKRQQELLIKENAKKLKRKEIKARKKMAEIKNEKLRQDIANKNRELAISTMSIIKKNEFLNSINDQLKEIDNSPKVKSVIKTINRSINNTDDWKFFEEAFNNADKDFLKKIKGLHPDLTPNDLKLCAYLRLNLSSKEIAPLLNISVRSVEVKRYRLRKKMDLQHEKSLTDYILNL
jgi:DNA-binding CsgD family transcriptional regulator